MRTVRSVTEPRIAATRLALCCGLALLLGAHPPDVRSQTVNEAQSAGAPSANERLMLLVPERAGDWVRVSLRGGRRGPDGVMQPAAEAEFERGDVRVSLRVGPALMPPPPPPAAPLEQATTDGTERTYGEAGHTVVETTRRVDGQVSVALLRSDSVVVTVQGYRTTTFELKTIALAVKPLPR